MNKTKTVDYDIRRTDSVKLSMRAQDRVKSVRIWSYSGPYFPAFRLKQPDCYFERHPESTEAVTGGFL